VIIDMRGATWSTVKPILKVLQEHFPGSVHIAYIIKPDNFWQKQRTSLGSHKYKFEVSVIPSVTEQASPLGTYGNQEGLELNGAHCSDVNSSGENIHRNKGSELKVKLSLCFTKHHAMKAYWGVEV